MDESRKRYTVVFLIIPRTFVPILSIGGATQICCIAY